MAVALITAVSLAAQDYPAHTGKVNDFAGLLTPDQRTQLGADLDQLERDTSAEVAVVTLPSLNGRSVEEYATGLFNTWGIGKADRDNGVLVLVSRGDRAMRIEVGYGLEGILPDGLAGEIIRGTFLPKFREGRYADGVLQGTARVVDIVRRHELVTDEQRAAYAAAAAAAAAEAGKSWGMAALMALFIGVGAFTAGTALGAKVLTQTLFGLVFTAGGMFGALNVAPRASYVPLVLFGLAVMVIGARLGRRPKWRRSIRGSGAGRGSGWMVSDSGGSSSGSSDSGGGGGSDFGGGSSGGGGASGSW